jgi:hypothetical protein
LQRDEQAQLNFKTYVHARLSARVKNHKNNSYKPYSCFVVFIEKNGEMGFFYSQKQISFVTANPFPPFVMTGAYTARRITVDGMNSHRRLNHFIPLREEYALCNPPFLET